MKIADCLVQPGLKLVHAFDRWLDRWNPYKPEEVLAAGRTPVTLEETRVRQHLVRIVTVAFAVFAVWATVAPIDAGVSVSGDVVVFGSRKSIQYPAVGVVKKIYVREGSHVDAGDLLVKVNPLENLANLNSIELDYINALTAESRLAAEKHQRSSIVWLPELEAMGDDSRVVEAKTTQQDVFASRRQDLLVQKHILLEQIDSAQHQLAESQRIVEIRQDELHTMNDDAISSRKLAEEGFVPLSKAHDAERSRSEALANLANVRSDIARIGATVAATRLQLGQIDVAFGKEVDAQFADMQKNRLAAKEKVDSLRFALSLTDLKAPVTGTVVGVKVTTEGGVIQPGQVLMDVVPTGSPLIVEAHVPLNMIDRVKVGEDADLRFSAFNTTTTPVVPGIVRLVGADRIEEPAKPDDGYYLVQIATDPRVHTFVGDKELQAGMPVDVIIKTGQRSFLRYLLKPMTERFARAFKED